MVVKTTIPERMSELASLEYLTLKEFAEVASVGITKALKLREELNDWINKTKKYRRVHTTKSPTQAVFDFLGIDRSWYLKGDDINE